jgi:hypothetical protein
VTSKLETAIYIILLLVGVIFTFLRGILFLFGFVYDQTGLINTISIGVGISLVATGVTGIIVSRTIRPKTEEEIEMAIKRTMGSPATFLQERRYINEKYYIPKFSTAKQIDIITLSMMMLLEMSASQDLVRWVVNDGKNIRILVLSPESPSAVLRGREEGIDLAVKIKEEIKRLYKLYRAFRTEINHTKKCAGSLEVRCYDGIPYFAYFRVDREIIMGLYYSHLEGNLSECILLKELNEPICEDVFRKMRDHFEALWAGKHETNTSPQDRVICKISRAGSYFMKL